MLEQLKSEALAELNKFIHAGNSDYAIHCECYTIAERRTPNDELSLIKCLVENFDLGYIQPTQNNGSTFGILQQVIFNELVAYLGRERRKKNA